MTTKEKLAIAIEYIQQFSDNDEVVAFDGRLFSIKAELEPDERPTAICSECAGSKVQVKTWVDANTGEQRPDDYDKSSTWCEDCEDHTGIDYITPKP